MAYPRLLAMGFVYCLTWTGHDANDLSNIFLSTGMDPWVNICRSVLPPHLLRFHGLEGLLKLRGKDPLPWKETSSSRKSDEL